MSHGLQKPPTCSQHKRGRVGKKIQAGETRCTNCPGDLGSRKEESKVNLEGDLSIFVSSLQYLKKFGFLQNVFREADRSNASQCHYKNK